MGEALRLAQRGYGRTSPNPMVGAVIVRAGKILARGWHRQAGLPHAEIEAFNDAHRRGGTLKGATLFVTLEPCSTQGRTPPCTEAIISSGIKRVIIGATDPNPAHAGRAFTILKRAGITVTRGVMEAECTSLNEAFNHWIVHRTPFVTVKAAMTLDGKIATATGESKWMTGEKARQKGMWLREGADGVLVGVNTIIADDPSLTFRPTKSSASSSRSKLLRRFVLDSIARTPLSSKVVSDGQRELTTVIVSALAPANRVRELSRRVQVLKSPAANGRVHLPWVLRELGKQSVTSLLVEGGGEVNASFLMSGLAQRIAFFYAPKILGGRKSKAGVAGDGAESLNQTIGLVSPQWEKIGEDLFLSARVKP
jgi:diaminohydroxyphosphoribosylaminopyrimidine deaminase/5-amino-6-(5-phosphoribosylamino)uracil reductase